jgi:hypothetical protein
MVTIPSELDFSSACDRLLASLNSLSDHESPSEASDT